MNEILQAASAFCGGTRPDPATVVTLVDQLRGRFGVDFVLRVLCIASSTYHAWMARQADPSRREREDRAITSEITDIAPPSGGTTAARRHTRSCGVGHPRVAQAGRAADAPSRFAGRLPA
ncbi:hypothetical protein [Saccharothrix sp. NRRL B-16348]|uniref:hypothetical protein n=1 Tax=Saccharothrix sp. NRRL B-16348 TaxID=1415542 RepID=UPI000AE75A48|nr:hypothetical protein [Saccharothrix sp. NRRL B-16348]